MAKLPVGFVDVGGAGTIGPPTGLAIDGGMLLVPADTHLVAF